MASALTHTSGAQNGVDSVDRAPAEETQQETEQKTECCARQLFQNMATSAWNCMSALTQKLGAVANWTKENAFNPVLQAVKDLANKVLELGTSIFSWAFPSNKGEEAQPANEIAQPGAGTAKPVDEGTLVAKEPEPEGSSESKGE